MSNLMLVEFILCMVPLVIAFFYFKDAPPTPPSHSTQLKLEQQEHQHLTHQQTRPSDRSMHTLPDHVNHGQSGSIASNSTPSSVHGSKHDEAHVLSEASGSSGGHSYESFSHTVSAKLDYGTPSPNNHATIHAGHATIEPSRIDRTSSSTKGNTDEEWESLKRDCWLLLKNRDYIILFFAFSIGVGFFNSIMTLLNQIVGPYGYSNDDAGTFGAVFIFCGLAGAGVAGKVTFSPIFHFNLRYYILHIY